VLHLGREVDRSYGRALVVSEVLLFASLPDYLRDDITAGNGRCVCPRCGGGTTREPSLDVRQDGIGVLKLKCFRASCSWFAVSVTDPNAKLQQRAIKPPSVYREPTVPIQGNGITILRNEYQCKREAVEQHGWRMSEHGTEFVLPVLDPYGNVRGHITRTLSKPKRVYTFKATAQPWLDHWRNSGSSSCVVVEDCISACRLFGLGFNAVALLGTGMTVEQAREIDKYYGSSKIYLALDNDAFEKSLHMAKRHRHAVKLLPVCLTQDIKNMQHDEDIRRLFP